MTSLNALTDAYTVRTFLKGINQSVSDDIIAIDEAIKAENVDISTGSLKSCKSLKSYSSADLSTSINCLMKYYHGSTGAILAASNGSIYKLVNNLWSSIGSGYTSNDFDYINYQSNLTEMMIYGNGKENMKVYDGVTLRDLKNNGKDSVAGSGNVSPKGRFIELHKERVWIAGDYNAPNTLYYSKDLDADDWTAPLTEGEANQHGGQFEMPSWDGGQIIGIKSLFDDLIVFKTNNVYKVFGYDAQTFSTNIVFDSVDGQIVDKSIANVNSKVFWLNTKGIYAFDGTNVTNLSDKIKDYFATINQAAISKAVGITFNNKYILAVPTGTSTENDTIIEYNFLTNSFVIKKGIAITAFIEFNDILLCTNNTGIMYTYGDSVAYMSGAVWESGLNSLGYLNVMKNISNVYFIGSGTGTIRIYVMTDRNRYGKYKDVVLSNSHDSPKSFNVKIKNKGRLIGIKIEGVGATDFKIRQPKLYFDTDVD